MAEANWPRSLILVRHGQSAGNVARDAAELAGHAVIDIAERDMDVPLSELGARQAAALGAWLGERPDERPTAVYASPYVRAVETARIVCDAGGIELDEPGILVDERLREREFGILDRLTRTGVRERHPDQADIRGRLGKFYFRPPGGESWADVILRLRSLIDTILLDCGEERVLVVTHQVVVLMFRYILEHLSEQEILAIDRAGDVANCSVTSYEREDRAGRNGALVLRLYNHVVPVAAAGEPVTAEPDAPVGPK